MITLTLATAAVVLPASSALAQGGFAKVGTHVATWEALARDARSEALGGADLAVATGPLAALTNAAPVYESDRAEAAFGWYEYHFDSDVQNLACSVQAGRWRFGAIGTRWRMDPIPIRTAYDPEGTGETIDVKQDFVLLNVAYSPVLVPMPLARNIDWTIGAGLRRHRYEMELDEDFVFDEDTYAREYDGWDTDLGLTGRWVTPLTGGNAAITGSVLFRNPFDQKVDLGIEDAFLPRFRNVGLAAEANLEVFGTGRTDLRFAVMLAYRKNLNFDDSYGFLGDNSLGVEITVLDIASLRIGTDNYRAYADEASWGLGLSLPPWCPGPFIARYDYTQLDGNPDFLYLERDQHTITAGIRF